MNYLAKFDESMVIGYLKSAGRTPHNTMRARLSVDVRDNPGTHFIQTAPGIYALK